MPILKNLLGQTFHKLTVIERVENDKNNFAQWLCECSCEEHNKVIVKGTNLVRGLTKSCGCLWKELRGPLKDLTNKRFGRLIAIEATENRDTRGSVIWKCDCDCGNIKYVSSKNLLANKTKSCGCISSKGEEKISSILLNNNVNFIKEYSPKDCINLETGCLLRFDFAILEDNQIKYCIEYDGVQHFEKNSFDNDSLKNIQKRDAIKNNWCIINNIQLIRIPYWDYNKITMEYIIKGLNL